MKTFIYYIFIFLSFTSFAQKILVKPPVVPFQTVKFDSFNPLWSVDIFDPTFIRNDTFDGYNEFDQVYTYGDHIHDGKLYKSHTIRNYDWMGFRVSCIDISTGDLLWVRKIDYGLYGRQHLPHYQTFDKEGNLVIIGFRKLYPYDPKEDAWFNKSRTPNKIFRMTINSTDGSILSYHSPDDNPNYVYALYLGSERWTFLGLDPRGSMEFLFEKYAETPTLRSLVQKGYIHVDGKLTITDSLVYSPNNWQISRTQYAKRDNKYYTLERSTIDNSKYIVEMDTSLRELSRVNISHFNIEDYGIELADYTKEYLIYAQAFPSPNNYNLRYFVVDYSGTLVYVMDIKDDFYLKYSDANITYDKKYNKLFIAAFGREINQANTEFSSFLDVLHYDGKKYELHKHLNVKEVNRYSQPWQVLYAGDDHIIFDSRVGAYYFDQGIKLSIGNASMALMAVSREELGILSSTEQDDVLTHDYHAFPNPSAGMFNLSLDGSFGSKEVRLYDIIGRNVYVDSGLEGENIALDLSTLPSGTYLYKVLQNSKTLTSGLWVKW